MHSYGLVIKALQIEVDESSNNKFQILDKIKSNDINMFENKNDNKNDNKNYYNNDNIQKNDIGEKILDAMKNWRTFGMSKSKVEKDNIKISSIIKNNDKSLFDDTEYVPVQDANKLVINI